MQIISHRGYWHKPEDKNTLIAFINTTQCLFGTETDIRDFNSELVISHDIPNSDSLKFDTVLEIFKESGLLLALNIKADGLQKLLQQKLETANFSNYFVFDMSIPDTKQYLKLGFNVFCRQSEYEKNIPFYNEIKGVWLDSFEEIWYDKSLINQHLLLNKKVCIVSAELHNRSHLRHWEILKSWNLNNLGDTILCTDFPELAFEYFNL